MQTPTEYKESEQWTTTSSMGASLRSSPFRTETCATSKGCNVGKFRCWKSSQNTNWKPKYEKPFSIFFCPFFFCLFLLPCHWCSLYFARWLDLIFKCTVGWPMWKKIEGILTILNNNNKYIKSISYYWVNLEHYLIVLWPDCDCTDNQDVALFVYLTGSSSHPDFMCLLFIYFLKRKNQFVS